MINFIFFFVRIWELLCVYEIILFIRCYEMKRSFELVKGVFIGFGIYVLEILGVRVMEKGCIF